MKQAKSILIIILSLTTTGGALAFKANRQSERFYTPGTTATTDHLVCNSLTHLPYHADPAGLTTILASTTIDNTNQCQILHIRAQI